MADKIRKYKYELLLFKNSELLTQYKVSEFSDLDNLKSEIHNKLLAFCTREQYRSESFFRLIEAEAETDLITQSIYVNNMDTNEVYYLNIHQIPDDSNSTSQIDNLL